MVLKSRIGILLLELRRYGKDEKDRENRNNAPSLLHVLFVFAPFLREKFPIKKDLPLSEIGPFLHRLASPTWLRMKFQKFKLLIIFAKR